MFEKRQRVYEALQSAAKAHELTVKQLAKAGARLMSQAKLHTHFFENHTLYHNALYLCFYVLGFPYAFRNRSLLSQTVSLDVTNQIIALFERRIVERKPVEYLTQEADYLGFRFYVNENVLVPRSLMHTRFADLLKAQVWENFRVLDMCTGSGCIGITLALLAPRITVDLVDISEAALAVAQHNIDKHQLNHRVRCIHSNVFEKIHEQYDLIISNPPYLTEAEYVPQPMEVKNEPKIALTAGESGLDIVDVLLKASKRYLNPQGRLIVEVGYPGAKRVKRAYPGITMQWYQCRSIRGQDPATDWLLPIIEWCIHWTPLLDGFFVCHAADLPNETSNT